MKFFSIVVLAALSLVTVSSMAGSKAKTVDSAYCWVPQTQQKVLGSQFFSLVHQASQQSHGCAVGRIFGEQSGRVYFDGRRLEKNAGSLSRAEVASIESQLLAEYGWSGLCATYTCDESNF